ncbi:MAG: helix-turn-helix domain-containing protein [Actinomycetota bacterium]|nr:helix-turn-helix domain-containing protein [Actinomycetota bacterium]
MALPRMLSFPEEIPHMSSPHQPSLGAMLRDARERAALSIDDVSERTRIRAQLIREIEADDFSGCGGNFYARGHVRSIATTLKLDPAPFVTRFNMQAEMTQPLGLPQLPTFDPAYSHGRSGRPPKQSKAAKARAAPIAAGSGQTRMVRAQRSGPNWTSAMLVAAAVVAILSVGSFALATLKRPLAQVDAHRPQVHAPSTSPGTPQSTPSSVPSSASPVPQTGVNLRLRVVNGSTWVRVLNGSGRSIFEAVLQTGDTKDFSDPKSLTVRYGNSTAVTVELNGQDKGSPASSCGGTVCTQRYDPGAASG